MGQTPFVNEIKSRFSETCFSGNMGQQCNNHTTSLLSNLEPKVLADHRWMETYRKSYNILRSCNCMAIGAYSTPGEGGGVMARGVFCGNHYWTGRATASNGP